MKAKYLTTNPSQTKKLGEALAKKILKYFPKKRAFTIGLEGDLGGGKTTFLQGFAKGLGIKQKILSPTFIIMKKFEIRNTKYETNSKFKIQNSKQRFRYLYHIDCYRIKGPKELLDLGFKEIISNPKNLIVIEWADRIKKILPKSIIWIKFNFVDKNIRQITIKCTGTTRAFSVL